VHSATIDHYIWWYPVDPGPGFPQRIRLPGSRYAHPQARVDEAVDNLNSASKTCGCIHATVHLRLCFCDIYLWTPGRGFSAAVA
jgi:hypothetical protein